MAMKAENVDNLIQIQQRHPIYTTYKKPIDLELAETHLKATRTGANRSCVISDMICACCGYHYNKKDLDICSNNDEFRYMGFAYPYLFKYALLCILALAVGLAVIGVPLYSQLPERLHCLTNECQNTEARAFVRENRLLVAGSAVACMLALMLMKWLFAKRVYVHHKRMDDILPRAQNFTAFVSGLDENEHLHEVQDRFNYPDGRELKIVKINKIYDIHDYVATVEQYVLEHNKLKEVKLRFNKDSKQYDAQYEVFIKSKLRVLDLKQRIEQTDELKGRYNGNAYVTFETPEELEKAIAKHWSPLKVLLPVNGLRVSRASSPFDVIWSNFGLTPLASFTRKISASIIIIVVMVFTSFIGRIIKDNELLYIQQHNHVSVRYYETLIALWILLMNYVLARAVKALVRFENHRSYTQQYLSTIKRKTLALWLNTTIAVVYLNYANGAVDYYSSTGVYQLLVKYCIARVLLFSAMLLLDFKYFQSLYRRARIRNNIKIQKDPNLFQYQAHKYFENQSFHGNQFIGEFLGFTSTMLFFSPATPGVLALGCVNLLVGYYAWKWVFVYRSAMPRGFDLDFVLKAAKLFSIPVFAFSLGYFLYEKQMLNDSTTAGAVILVVGIMQLLLPDEMTFARLFQPELSNYSQSHTTAQLKFDNDYDRLNPASQYRAYLDWLRFVKVFDVPEDLTPSTERNQYRVDREHLIQTLFDYVTVYKKTHHLARPACENPFCIVRTDQFDVMGYFNFYKLEKNAAFEMRAYRSDFYHQMLESQARSPTRYQPLEEESYFETPAATTRKNIMFNTLVLSDIAAINRELVFEKRNSNKKVKEGFNNREEKLLQPDMPEERCLTELKTRLFSKFVKNSYFLNFDPSSINKEDTNLTPTSKENVNTPSMPHETNSVQKKPCDEILNSTFLIDKDKTPTQPVLQLKPSRLSIICDKKTEEGMKSNIGTPLREKQKSIAPERFIDDLSIIMDSNK